jgi:hypothetical protein
MSSSEIRIREGDLLAALATLPDRKDGAPRREWTRSELMALAVGWKIKRQQDISKLVKHSLKNCREKFEELEASGEGEKIRREALSLNSQTPASPYRPKSRSR